MKYLDVSRELINGIETGRFQFGEKIPSIRQLVDEHHVSKNTAIKALEETERLGYIAAKPRSGFYVSWQPRTAKTTKSVTATPDEPKPVNLTSVFHTVMEKGAAFDYFPSAAQKYTSPYFTNLTQCLSRAFKTESEINAGYYGEPKGDKTLRKQIANRYRERDTLVDFEDIVITSGCQNALYLALSAVANAGDTIAVESPAFYGVLQLLEQLSLKILEVPSRSEGGLDLDYLSLVSEKHDITAVVLMPNFATPTGLSMPLQQRTKLMELAELNDFYLIEDDIYGELGFVKNLPPILKQDQGRRVLTCGSFSKSLSRDLRIGWLIAPKHIAGVLKHKLTTQLASPVAVQKGVAEFVAKGNYRRHLNHFCKHLLVERNKLLSELKSYWPAAIDYPLPQGGLSFWLKLPTTVDTQKLYQVMLARGIVLTPGLLFTSDKRFSNCLRLSFHQPLEGERLGALRELALVIREELEGN